MTFMLLLVAFVFTVTPLCLEIRLKRRFKEIYLRDRIRSLGVPTAICILAVALSWLTDLNNTLHRFIVAVAFSAFFVAHCTNLKIGSPRWTHLIAYAPSSAAFLIITYAYYTAINPIFVPALTMGLLFCLKLLKICNILHETSKEIAPLTERIASLEASLHIKLNTRGTSQVPRDNPDKAS